MKGSQEELLFTEPKVFGDLHNSRSEKADRPEREMIQEGKSGLLLELTPFKSHL